MYVRITHNISKYQVCIYSNKGVIGHYQVIGLPYIYLCGNLESYNNNNTHTYMALTYFTIQLVTIFKNRNKRSTNSIAEYCSTVV